MSVPVQLPTLEAQGDRAAAVFDDAVRSDDWPTAVTSLAKLAVPTTKLHPLALDQLRLLQDAVIRARTLLGGVARVLQIAIAVELQSRGVPAAKIAAGTAFGKLGTKIDESINGDKATDRWYTYKINIGFAPDPAVVDAEEIAFIQTVRLVETMSGANVDPEQTNQKRQTPSATSVDRRSGKEQGWYGMKDDATGSTQLSVWKKSAPASPATMWDRSSWNQPNTTWQFETMVVCRCGADAGKVYGVVTWGFTVDADLKLTQQTPTVTTKQSAEATAAVHNWNDQVAGSASDRNAPAQISLPALR